MKWHIDDSFSRELPADLELTQRRRQVLKACFSYVTPRVPSNPERLHVSGELLSELGFDQDYAQSEEFLSLFSGSAVLSGTKPYAMCYAGHQFGNWAGQLGDGRAINLFEHIHQGNRFALQLKGAGETPYSRSADGLAVLRSSIREHLCSEAMHHLGVPTTRSLSLVLTGDEVLRDIMYDGNPAYERGAVVCRVAPSFIRIGNFQIFAARNDMETLRQLTDYTIRHFFADIKVADKAGVIELFRRVTQKTLEMIIHWQRVGFVHGVMNTDNMSILGLTIDYGPYGWLEPYDPDWTPNSTDRQTKRYRYGQQPGIALWNLAQLASALYPLVEEAKPFEEIIESYKSDYQSAYQDMMRIKLGLLKKENDDHLLIKELTDLFQKAETDMTIFFRNLYHLSLLPDPVEHAVFEEAFYSASELTIGLKNEWREWLQRYQGRIILDDSSIVNRKSMMLTNNPKYVLRNYMAHMAAEQADKGDYTLIDEFYRMLLKPYEEQPEFQKWFAKRPDWAREKVGCSMLSCSS